MPEVTTDLKTYRFDQMAVQVKDKVHPDETDADRYVGLEHIDPESLKIRRWGEPSDVESTKILFRAGDIIFGKRRAYQRKLAVADFDGICSAHAMVLRPKTDVVLKEFLPFFMQTDAFMERAVKISVGGLSPTINWKDLAKEEFALPPIEEQRRLASALIAASCVADAHTQLVELLGRVKKSYFEKQLQECVSSGLPLISIGELTTDHRSGASLKPEDFTETGMTVLHKGDIGPSGAALLKPQRNRFCTNQAGKINASKQIDNSFLVMTTRDLVETGPTIGMVSCVRADGPILPAQGVFAFRTTNAVLPGYIIALSVSPWYRRRILSMAVGSTQIHVRTSEILSLRIPVPDIDKQRTILSCIEGIQSLQDRSLKRVSIASQIRKSIVSASTGTDSEALA